MTSNENLNETLHDGHIEDTAHDVKRRSHDVEQKAKSSIAGGTWTALLFGIVLLVILLVFILQNQNHVDVNFFSWTWRAPSGVSYLISALIGAAIMALVGGWRIVELRRQVRRANRDEG